LASPQWTDDGDQEAHDIEVEEFERRCDGKQQDCGPIAGIRSGGIEEGKQVAIYAIGHESPPGAQCSMVVVA